MATGAKLGFDPARFYVWKAPGNAFSIHLSLDVVQELTQALARSASESPPRDITGVLLGRARAGFQPSSVVEEFVLDVGNENKDRSELPHDDAVSDMIWKLVRGAGSGRHVVGFFRSQRDGLLVPDDRDLANANRLLGEPDNLMLLVRYKQQGECDAAFFYWERGKAQPYFTGPPFPFDVAKLSGGIQVVPRTPDPIACNDPVPTRIPARVGGEPKIWLRLMPTVGFFVVVTAGAQMLWPSHTAEVSSAPELTTVRDSPIGLKVAARPHQLEIRWNHESTLIQAAGKALVRISEGGVTEVVPVAREELRDGFVAYAPKTNDVAIRFEVSGPDGSTISESVRVVTTP